MARPKDTAKPNFKLILELIEPYRSLPPYKDLSRDEQTITLFVKLQQLPKQLKKLVNVKAGL